MSSSASIEEAQSPEELAGIIDRELEDVATYIPGYVLTSPLGVGVPHELYRIPGTGTLRAIYLGFLAGPHKLGRLFDEASPQDRYSGVRVVAEDDRSEGAWWQDFALSYHGIPRLIVPTAVADVERCQQQYPHLPGVLHTLHEAYVERVRYDDKVVDLAKYARSRVEQQTS